MPVSEEIVLDYPVAAALVARHAAALSRLPSIETIAVELAPGRCLASPVFADRDQPAFDRSTRDGYAVRAADLLSGSPLKVVGLLRAGQPPFAGVVGVGEALEIMTGAPIPAGADAVLMVEHADVIKDGALPGETPFSIQPQTGRTLVAGQNIVPAGSEAKAGSHILAAGVRLSPMHIGAAVASGAATVAVYRRPRVAILATGDELVEPGGPLAIYQIRNSNSYSLMAQVERAGGEPVRLPIARDNLLALRQSLDHALACDLVLLSGGVSMGKFDFVEQALLALNATFFFTGVKIQPGKPLVFGWVPRGGRVPVAGQAPSAQAQEKYFFGLPGNPVSTMVTFALFAAPLIRALGGEQQARPLFARATVTAGFEHKPGFTRFLPALLTTAWDHAEVTPVAWQGSGDLASVARANCFVVIPPDVKQLGVGDEVSVLLAYC